MRAAATQDQAKECMREMSKNVAECILKELKESSSSSLYDNKEAMQNSVDAALLACHSNPIELDSKLKTLLVAFSYLIDQENASKINCYVYLTYKLEAHDLSVVNMLKSTYVVSDQVNGFTVDDMQQTAASKRLKMSQNDGFNAYECSNYSYNSYPQQQQQPTAYPYHDTSFNYTNLSGNINNSTKSVQINDATSLKVLHFLLILFSSFLTMDNCFLDGSADSPEDAEAAAVRSSTQHLTAASCQRLIRQLLDTTCKDPVVKTKILLSISELDLI
jgi:hypothetical protein